MHLFDLLEKREIVPHEEAERIDFLFNERLSFYRINDCSLYNLTNHYFKDLKCRHTFISVHDFLGALNLKKISNDWTITQFFLFCESVGTFLYQLHNLESSTFQLKYDSGDFKMVSSQVVNVMENIKIVLRKYNYQIEIKDDFVYIVEKNKSTTEAIECIEDEDIAFELLEYNRYLLKGKVEEKRKILRSMASYVEPILKSGVLRKNGYSNLESDTGFYLNNFHIRHNNKKGKDAKEFIINMDDNTLESWYDIAYNTMLSVIIINKQIENHAELEKLKKENNL